MTSDEITLQQRVASAVDQAFTDHFGEIQGELWSILSDEQLYALEVWLWGHHQDLVSEWSRRQMRAADPKP